MRRKKFSKELKLRAVRLAKAIDIPYAIACLSILGYSTTYKSVKRWCNEYSGEQVSEEEAIIERVYQSSHERDVNGKKVKIARYKYSKLFKEEVIEYRDTHTNKETELHFDIPRTTIEYWYDNRKK